MQARAGFLLKSCWMKDVHYVRSRGELEAALHSSCSCFIKRTKVPLNYDLPSGHCSGVTGIMKPK